MALERLIGERRVGGIVHHYLLVVDYIPRMHPPLLELLLQSNELHSVRYGEYSCMNLFLRSLPVGSAQLVQVLR